MLHHTTCSFIPPDKNVQGSFSSGELWELPAAGGAIAHTVDGCWSVDERGDVQVEITRIDNQILDRPIQLVSRVDARQSSVALNDDLGAP